MRLSPSTPLATVVVVGCLLAAATALAKGQLTPNQQAAPVRQRSTSDTTSATANTANGVNDTTVCADITQAQCNSATYAVTPCGRYHTERAMEGNSACNAMCSVPTLEQCGQDTYYRSVCGTNEARKMMMIPGDVGVADTSVASACPVTSSKCVDLLCQKLATLQGNGRNAILGNPVMKRVVLPTFAAANLGDDTSDLISVQNGGYADVTAMATRPTLQPDFKTWRFEAGSSHWWGRRLANHIAYLPTSATLNGLTTVAAQRMRNQRALDEAERARWEDNHEEVDECREYVYEKYFDYSKYEDAAFVAGADYRQIYNTAFGNALLHSSIGTRIIAGTGLLQRDGQAVPATLSFQSNVPRNAFYSYVMPGNDVRTNSIAKWNEDNHRYRVMFQNNALTVELNRPLFVNIPQGGSVSIINGFPFVPLNGPLFGQLRNRTLHDESLQFHKARSEALGRLGIPDEVLFVYDRLKDDFLRMVQQRADIEAELRELGLLAKTVDVSGFRFQEVFFDPTIVEHSWQELFSPIDAVLDAQRIRSEIFDAQAGHSQSTLRQFGAVRAGVASRGTVVGQGQQRTTSGSTATTSGSAVGTSMGGFRGQQNATQQGFGQTPPGRPAPTRGANTAPKIQLRFVTLLKALVDLDARMEAALLNANDLGCIDPAKSPFSTSPCDWSPRDFAEMMQDQLVTTREQDLERCERFTGGDFDSLTLRSDVPGRFSPVVNAPTDIHRDVVFPAGTNLACDNARYNVNPTKLDRYPGCRDAWRVAIMENINAFYQHLEGLMKGAKDLIDPVTGKIRPQEETADSDGFGDSTFGASYDYRAGWAMDLPDENDWENPGNACQMRPQAHATFDVVARVFGEEAELVSASIEAGVGEGATNRAVVEIVGVELIDVGQTGSVNAGTYNVLFEATEFDYNEFFHASATFMIGPVPVTVSAGAAGIISASVTGAGGTIAGGDGCSNGDLGLEMVFTPTYGISGFASAGVDALIVEVGVKIELTLINLAFPLRVGLNLEHTGAQNGGTWKMQLTNDLDIVMSILGGRLAGYVEVCFVLCEEFDVTIFRWAPTRLKTNLFHSAIDLDMHTLLRAQTFFPLTVPGSR